MKIIYYIMENTLIKKMGKVKIKILFTFAFKKLGIQF